MDGSRQGNLKVTYRRRRGGLLKKARELSILCGIQVLLICISPDGAADTWPDDSEQVLDAIARYRGHRQIDQDKHKEDLISYLLKQRSKKRTREPSRQFLADLAQSAASKLDAVRMRIQILTNTSSVSESNRDKDDIENVTNPPPQSSEADSSAVESISHIESAANNSNVVQHQQQQYYHYAYVAIPGPSSDPKNVSAAAALAFQPQLPLPYAPPILLWPQISATPDRMTLEEDKVPKGKGGGEAEEEIDTQLRLGG